MTAARGVIHLPALRGNPQRTYRTAAVHGEFRGVFNDYTAGVIAVWQNRARLARPGVLIHEGKERLAGLARDLELLGLTWHVEARQLDDANVELLVDRLPHARQDGSRDLVSMADVGFGVSQTLPVVVALQVAAPGQLVYLEQPEIHLHPRAQVAFAELLRAAAARGARVVVETHSALLLRAIQTMVAKGTLDSGDIALHWFSRDPETGLSKVVAAGEVGEVGGITWVNPATVADHCGPWLHAGARQDDEQTLRALHTAQAVANPFNLSQPGR